MEGRNVKLLSIPGYMPEGAREGLRLNHAMLFNTDKPGLNG
jgi:hypothetical protein